MSFPYDEFRIMVVDPDPVAANNLSDTLQSHGYIVRAVYVADAALMAAEKFRPHAVISEVVMPGMNGIDLANRLVERYSDCRVLLMSSSESVIELMEDIMPADVLTFVRKPLNVYEVMQALTNWQPAS